MGFIGPVELRNCGWMDGWTGWTGYDMTWLDGIGIVISLFELN